MYKEEKWAILKIRLELWKTKSFICKKKWPKDWYNAIVYIPECMFFTDYIFLLFIFHSPPLLTSSWFFIMVSRINNKCDLNWFCIKFGWLRLWVHFSERSIPHLNPLVNHPQGPHVPQSNSTWASFGSLNGETFSESHKWDKTETKNLWVFLARPRLSLKWSRKQDRDYTIVSFINETSKYNFYLYATETDYSNKTLDV